MKSATGSGSRSARHTRSRKSSSPTDTCRAAKREGGTATRFIRRCRCVIPRCPSTMSGRCFPCWPAAAGRHPMATLATRANRLSDAVKGPAKARRVHHPRAEGMRRVPHRERRRESLARRPSGAATSCLTARRVPSIRREGALRNRRFSLRVKSGSGAPAPLGTKHVLVPKSNDIHSTSTAIRRWLRSQRVGQIPLDTAASAALRLPVAPRFAIRRSPVRARLAPSRKALSAWVFVRGAPAPSKTVAVGGPMPSASSDPAFMKTARCCCSNAPRKEALWMEAQPFSARLVRGGALPK